MTTTHQTYTSTLPALDSGDWRAVNSAGHADPDSPCPEWPLWRCEPSGRLQSRATENDPWGWHEWSGEPVWAVSKRLRRCYAFPATLALRPGHVRRLIWHSSAEGQAFIASEDTRQTQERAADIEAYRVRRESDLARAEGQRREQADRRHAEIEAIASKAAGAHASAAGATAGAEAGRSAALDVLGRWSVRCAPKLRMVGAASVVVLSALGGAIIGAM